MIVAKIPSNESARLAKLIGLQILDTEIEERFERITRLACSSLDVPICAISLVDKDRQWFKSIKGLDVRQTPRDVAFCAHAILENQPFIVNDARQDKRFECNPLVTEEPGIQFYAGIPLDLGDGLNIGTICAIDLKPRDFPPEKQQLLLDLSQMVKSELSLSSLANSTNEKVDGCGSFLTTKNSVKIAV